MEKEKKVLALLLISFGFLLRVLRLRELMGFDWDQEVAAFAVDRILSGDLTLIGQEISVGGIFIGPGYYYLLSVFYWLFGGDPIGVGVMVALLSIVTMTVLFLLTRELFDYKTALIALGIYAVSSKINFYDRTTAPSNSLMLTALLTIFLLWKMKKSRYSLFPFLAAVISFSIIHLHPSAIVLLPMALVLRKHWNLSIPSKDYLPAAVIVIAIIISPLVVFDLRHGFINSNGIIKALTTPGEEAYIFALKFLLNLRIQIETFSSLFGLGKFNIPVALIIMLSWILHEDKKKWLIGYWILIPAITLSFYSRHIPEYYFLSSLPAFILIAARTTLNFWKGYQKYFVLGILIFVLFSNLKAIIRASNPYSLYYRQKAVDYIKKEAGEDARVAFDTDLGLIPGFGYLLDKEGIKIVNPENNPTHTIVMPPERDEISEDQVILGGIKIVQNQ